MDLQQQLEHLQNELNEVRKQMAQPNSLSEMVLNTIEEGVCITDQYGYFSEVNEAYAELYGYTKEELLGKHFTMMLPEEAREAASELHDDFIAGRKVETPRQWEVVNKQGETMEVFVKPARYVSNDGQVYKVTTVRNVTEENQLRRRLQELTQA